MTDFWKKVLDGKKEIDSNLISPFLKRTTTPDEQYINSVILRIHTKDLKFNDDVSKDDQNKFLKSLVKDHKLKDNPYLLRMLSGEKYHEIATRMLGGSDFSIDEFKKFFYAADLLGKAKYCDLNSNTNTNLMQLATFYGRYDAYLFLKNEIKMNPVEYITGDDLAIDGQRYYRSFNTENGVEVFQPFSNDANENSNTDFIQQRQQGVRSILIDLINKAKQENGLLARWIGDNYIQNIAAYFELNDVLKTLYKDPNIEVNPVSPKGRGASPVQIFMANDLRSKTTEFITQLKALEQQSRIFKIDINGVGYAIINYPEEWELVFSKCDLDKYGLEDISNFWKGSFTMLLQNENIADKANKTQRIEYVAAILRKYPKILNGYTETARTIFESSFDPESNDENKKILNSIFSAFLENIKTTDNEAANNFIDHMISKINLLEIDKNKLLAASIFHGRADIINKLIFEHGVNPDDLVIDKGSDKSLKRKVIELANECPDENQRKAIKHCLRKYKKIEEEAFKLVTRDLEKKYHGIDISVDSELSFVDQSESEGLKNTLANYEITGAKIEEAGFGLKVKAFIKFMTSKLNWNDAKVSAYYEEKIVPELRAEFEKKPDDVSADKSATKKYLREQVEEKKKEVLGRISSDSPRR